MPVYNGEKTIKEAISSVLNQTFSDFELLVIDNGSIDNTDDIVNSFKDKRIRLLNTPRTNSAKSRNYGIAKSNAEYLSFLDADDLWLQDKLLEQYRALQQRPEAAVAYSWTDHIDENGKFLYPGTHAQFTGNVYPELLVSDFIESGSNILVKKSAVCYCGGFDESLNTAEDWDFWLRLARVYTFTVIPRVHVLYRHCLRSKSFNISAHKKAVLSVIERNYARNPLLLQQLKKQSYAYANLYLCCKTVEQYLTKHNWYRPILYLWLWCNNISLLRIACKRIAVLILRHIHR
ncbi:MAG: glycosyltransferase [Candidatus Omnitrophica bacterium]|nr:glycosyltransferase [Candidatus Omnitrophota bacterium]